MHVTRARPAAAARAPGQSPPEQGKNIALAHNEDGDAQPGENHRADHRQGAHPVHLAPCRPDEDHGSDKLDKDAPTLTEAGVNLTFTNWRGILAPPGISDDARQALVKVLEELHGTDQWKEALVKNGWTDAFETGAPFERFLKDQDNRVSSTLTDLGLV